MAGRRNLKQKGNKMTSQYGPARATLRLTATSALACVGLLLMAGCSSMNTPVPVTVPTAQTVAGMEPSGTVTLTEKTIGGTTVGKGVLSFGGKKHPFDLIGSVIGPGGLSSVDVTGDVYKLDKLADFGGAYAQGSGQELETSGAADLWLESKAGVVMHLTGTQTGATLSLGRDEIFIKMR
jgi:hypothetical protein